MWDTAKQNENLKYVHLVVILLCPLVGAAFFFGSFLLLRTGLRDRELTYSDISFDASRHNKKQKSDFMEEVDILPLEEAFVVSEKKDRRKALLTTLKKDYNKNISSVLLGLNNEDGETSHYAASVVLSTISDYLNALGKLKGKYDNNPEDIKASRDYMACLKEFMDSNILDNIEKIKYSKIYLSVFEHVYNNFRDDVSDEDYVYIVGLLIEIKDEDSAKYWAERAIRNFPESDIVNYNALRLHFTFGDHERFLELLQYIMKSDINISNETVSLIRFFNYRQ